MILSDKTISRMLKEKSLVIEPITDDQIQPASVDVRLGNTFSVVEDTPTGIITLSSEIKYKTITAEKYLLLPGQFHMGRQRPLGPPGPGNPGRQPALKRQ